MLNVTHLVQSGGLILIAAFLYAEVGLFLGFFLPGDTLLIAAGIYAKEGKLSIAAVIVVAAIAAIAGDSTAYFIGRKAGPRIFKEHNVIFRQEHVVRAEAFYEKHGPKTLLVAHFIAVIRTLSPLLAGVARMQYSRFLTFDIIGDVAWAVIVTLLGYYVGSRIPNIDHYILLVLALVIICSLVPTIYHLVRLTLKKRRLREQPKP
jgi:membrane-associated protein